MSRDALLLKVLEGRPASRVPVWAMRQAGRVLARYRRIRAEVGDFRTMVRSPELAAQVTLLPVEDIGVDAAIIFSDILVIPEAMGFPYKMSEGRGPYFEDYVQRSEDVERLRSIEPQESLDYVLKALSMSRRALPNDVPLVGFSGAPWTLLAYLLEGGGSRTYARARRFLYQEPDAAHRALSRISEAVAAYLIAQANNGADCLQIFDTLAEVLPPMLYKEFGFPYLKKITEALDEAGAPPLIVFAKGAAHHLSELAALPAAGVSVDWMTPISYAKAAISSSKVLQGNFDPALLYAPRPRIAAEVKHLLEEMRERPYVANLGHGLYPDISEDKFRFWVDCVKSYPHCP